MKIEFKWESMGDSTWRAKVIGGWIVAHIIEGDKEFTNSMVFIPDPKHEWEIQ